MEGNDSQQSAGAKKIFLIGGTGRTGVQVAELCLREGHSVTAAVRRPPQTEGVLSLTIPIQGTGSSKDVFSEGTEQAETPSEVTQSLGPHDRLQVVQSSMEEDNLRQIMQGHDIVIAIIGGWPAPDQATMTNFSDPARSYIPAMKACGITRYFTVMGAGFLGPIESIPTDWSDEGMNPEMVAINKIRRDMRILWDLILENDLNYTVWCPAWYPSGPISSDYTQAKNDFVGDTVTTGMVADSMVKEIRANELQQSRVSIAANSAN